VALTTDVDAAATVEADPEQLHRILINLLRNAREAVDQATQRKGRGKVSVGLARDDGASLIRIADDGPGLPERARTHIFQPFAGSTRAGGAGLGLAIARELAQAHGGDLSLVESSPKGTTFELRLPGPGQ
jgi:signal transduction histidine kinase